MTDAEFEQFSRELAASILAETDDLVRFSHHEEHIRAHLNCAHSGQENKIKTLGFEFCLDEHYLNGGPHPHDYNIPLNQWDNTPD